jgi:uncharacterized membrane protein
MFLKTEKFLIPVLCLVMAGLGLWGHATLPDASLAVHFDMSGSANGFMPRDMGLAVLPGLAVVLMIALLWIVPAVMPRSASLDRSEAPYGATLLATFMLLTVTQAMLVLVAQGVAIDHVRITAAGVGLLLIVIGNYLPKTRRNYAMGVRTPWALADERVWDKTHRLAGPLFMLGGFVAVVGAVFGPPHTHVVVLVIASLAPAVVSYIYSCLVARRLNLT